MKYGKTSMNEAKINLFAAISECFSKPVTDEDDTLDYIPTQYISEYAKNLGYDGIAFVSSVFPKVDFDDLGGINFVIFNFCRKHLFPFLKRKFLYEFPKGYRCLLRWLG